MRPLRFATAAAIAAAALAAPAAVRAQGPDQEYRRDVSFSAGGSFGDGDAALASSAGLGLRIAPRVGLDVELAYARRLDFTLDLCPPPLVCVRGGRLPVTGRTVSLVPHLAIDLPGPPSRLRVYILGGVGAGHVRQRYVDTLLYPVERRESTRSSLVAAVSFGGGAAVKISRRLAVGADVRSLHLLDEEAPPQRFIVPAGTLGTVRANVRVSWLF